VRLDSFLGLSVLIAGIDSSSSRCCKKKPIAASKAHCRQESAVTRLLQSFEAYQGVGAMGRNPESQIERLKRDVSVQRLAESRGVKLKRHGADMIGLCPFHDDHSPL
jgi:hypothetical protein